MYKEKTKYKVVLMVVLALLLQIVGPVAQTVYGEVMESRAFTFEIVRQEDGSGKYEWSYNPEKAKGKTEFEINLKLKLTMDFSDLLIDSETGEEIGEFTISKDGILMARIYEVEEELEPEETPEEPEEEVEEEAEDEVEEAEEETEAEIDEDEEIEVEEEDEPEEVEEVEEVDEEEIEEDPEQEIEEDIVEEDDIVEEEIKDEADKIEITDIIVEFGKVIVTAKATGLEEDEKAKIEILNEKDEVAAVAEEVQVLEDQLIVEFDGLEAGKYYAKITIGEVSEVSEEFQLMEAEEADGEDEEIVEDDEEAADEPEEDLGDGEVSFFGKSVATLATAWGNLENLFLAEADPDEEPLEPSSGGGMIPFGFMMPMGGGEINPIEIIDVEIYDAKPTENNDGTITKNGNKASEIRMDSNKEIALIYDWKLPEDHGYKEYDTFTFTLPEEFNLGALQASALGGDLVGEIGTYLIDKSTGVVTFTFNEDVEAEGERNGYFYVWVKFDLNKFENGLEQEVDFHDAINKQIRIHFNKPNSEIKITKDGSVSSSMNPATIDWVVDFNLNEEEIDEAIFKDTLPNGLTIDMDSIEIYELTVNINGTIEAGTIPILDKESEELEGTDNGFTIDFGDITKAYRVKYSTKVAPIVEEPFKGSFTNKVEVSENGITKVFEKDKKVDVKFSKPLSKSSISYDPSTQKITWKIEFNYNEQFIAKSDAIITDTFDKRYQELDEDSFVVMKAIIGSDGKGTATGNPLTKSTDFSVVSTEGFTLQFEDDEGISEAYEIRYETKVIDNTKDEDRLHEDVKVYNTVEYGSNKVENVLQDVQQGIFRKSLNSIDYADKTIEWKIELNKDEKTMKDVVIEDTFTDQNMEFLENSLDITDMSSDAYDVEPMTDYNNGFKIEFKSAITNYHIITFKTKYDSTLPVPENGGKNQYKNYGLVKWKEGHNTDELTKDSTAYAPLDNYSTDNGNKTGTYNANTKEITWTIDVNYNLHDIVNAIVEDNYTGTQSFVEGSLVLYKLNLSGDANGVTLGDSVDISEVTEEPTVNQYRLTTNGFKLNLGNINSAYRITYKTSLSNTEIEGTYSNNASLTGDDNGTQKPYFTKVATVTPENGGEYIRKKGKQGTGDNIDIATWTVGINHSQSQIESNSVLTDTLSNNQILLPETIKVYTTTIPADNSGNVNKSIEYPELDDNGELNYETSIDSNNKNKFTITFKTPISTAYIVEYQAFITASNNEDITNEASYEGKEANKSTDKNSIKVSFSEAGGGAAIGKAQLTILKEDDKGNPLKGVKFELYNNSGSILLEELITGIDGRATTAESYKYNSTSGYKYKLKEVESLVGYLTNGYEVAKEILFKGETSEIKIVNTKIRQSIELFKEDSKDNTPLEGAKFKLLKKNGGSYEIVSGYEEIMTDNQGKIYIGDMLEQGEYQLVEIEAPIGYWLDTTPINYTVDLNQIEASTKTVTNTKQGNLKILKTDSADNSPLQGAVFTLTDTTNPAHTYTTTDTGAEGIAIFSNVRYGTYKLTETTAPTGYVGGAEQIITLDDDNNILLSGKENLLITVTNEKIHQAVKLVKVDKDDDSLKLSGAVFKLYKDDGTQVTQNEKGEQVGDSDGRLVVNSNGEISVNNLPAGDYYFKEIAAPEYYLLPTGEDAKTSFIIEANQTIITEITAKNERGTGSIEITKTGLLNEDPESRTLLEGVTFGLYKDDKTTLVGINQTTAPDGKVTFSDLPYGKYILKEISTIDNYVLNTDEIEIILDGNGDKDYKVEKEISNKQKTYAIGDYTWIDPNRDGIQDGDEEVLAGVIVELYKEGTIDPIAETITDDNGRYIFDELESGTYKVKFVLTEEQAKIYRFTLQDAESDSVDTRDSDANPVVGDTEYGFTDWFDLNDTTVISQADYDSEYKRDQNFKATQGIDPTWDAGVIKKTYAIGDYTWIDRNNNGIQDDGEEILEGVKVEIFYDEKGENPVLGEDGEPLVTETDENGLYIFDELDGGDYYIKFTLTNEQSRRYRFTVLKSGDDRAKDSDANRNTGWTQKITLDDSNTNLTKDYDSQAFTATEGIDPTWDAGVVRRPTGGGGTPPPKEEEPEEPTEPDQPEEPEEPEEPEKPTEPEKPEEPKKPFSFLIFEDPEEDPEGDPEDGPIVKQIIETPVIFREPGDEDNPSNRIRYNPKTKRIEVDDLEDDEEVEVIVTTTIEDEEIVVGKLKIRKGKDGEPVIEEELIDPYGTIRDSETNDPVGDVELKIYFADTPRNRENGRTPGTLVNLPVVPGFTPNDNRNPQISVHELVWSDETGDHGNYAWLVFPKTDYYIVAKRTGYEDYTSPTISVEYDIIKHDITMLSTDGDGTLPKTGEGSHLPFYIIGLVMIVLGYMTRKRKIA